MAHAGANMRMAPRNTIPLAMAEQRLVEGDCMKTLLGIAVIAWALVYHLPAAAQQSDFRGRIGQLGCQPVSERTTETGCWIMANVPLGRLPAGPIFWHLDVYSTRAAAEAAMGPPSTVVEALEKIWLFTIAPADWHAEGGEHVAKIGPLPVDPAAEYKARYMEAIFAPGMTSSIHRHPGPEVWYTLAGETCLETSAGRMIGRAGGDPVIVPGGLPMYLTATGKQMRRAVVLILYDATKPVATPASDWTPKGLCNGP
jgi:quercetin dioxygenase-like cupin family protein